MNTAREIPTLDGSNVAFRKQVARYTIDENGCWIYAGARNASGYGALWVNGSVYPAHRVYYAWHVGRVPAGSIICHMCDTPACVNPEHLFLGSSSDNARDALHKGRAFQKLTIDAVRQIKSDSRPFTEIALAYRVSPCTVAGIKEGYLWAWVPGAEDGRKRLGYETRLSKLNDNDRERIVNSGDTLATLAKRFGVSKQAIAYVKNRADGKPRYIRGRKCVPRS